MALFACKAVSLDVDDWKKVTDFMKLPSTVTAAQLQNLLDTHKPTAQNDDIFV